MSLATNDVDAVRMAVGAGLLVFADSIFYFLTIPVAMWILSPTLCLIALAPLPILPWIVLWNEHKINARFDKVQESFAQLSAMAQESLAGVRVLKAFVREDAQTRRFAREGERYAELSLRLARIQAGP
jgi:ATP-binding cassette subfamily B protein